MAYMFGALSTAKLLQTEGVNDELIDRLHYIATSMSLAVAAVCVCAKQFAGKPIECALYNTLEDTDEVGCQSIEIINQSIGLGRKLLLLEKYIFRPNSIGNSNKSNNT